MQPYLQNKRNSNVGNNGFKNRIQWYKTSWPLTVTKSIETFVGYENIK